MTDTFAGLRAILVRDYQLDPDSVTLEAPLAALGIDSLAVAELLFTVEDEFKLKLSPDSLPLTSVGDVVRYLDALVAAQAGGAAQPTAGCAASTVSAGSAAGAS